MNNGKLIMRASNSLEVNKKNEIRLFSLRYRIGLTSGQLRLPTDRTRWARHQAKGEGVLNLWALALERKQGAIRSFLERAIKAVFKQNTSAQTLQYPERVCIGWKLMRGLYAQNIGSGQQKTRHESTTSQHMAIEVR
jgi:hypothetical protein